MEKDLNENDDGNGKKMKIDFFFLSFFRLFALTKLPVCYYFPFHHSNGDVFLTLRVVLSFLHYEFLVSRHAIKWTNQRRLW